MFETDDEGVFLQHVEGAEGPHAKAVAAVSAHYVSPMCHGDMVAAAVALLERCKVPCVGAAVTRRVLRRLAEAACDAEVQALVCFVCGQAHTTARGPLRRSRKGDLVRQPAGMSFRSAAWFREVEACWPGVQETCGLEAWQARYRDVGADPELAMLWEWATLVQGLGPRQEAVVLLGVTEDVRCALPHLRDARCRRAGAGALRVCEVCEIPLCQSCIDACSRPWRARVATQASAEKSAQGAQETPIAMALANDHFYGYVPRMLLSEEVTWLEVAAASTIWTSMLVYYLEAPFGHLQLEHMRGPRARTASRGNLFSFLLPWQQIQAQCENLQRTVPRGEEELARLVHVHIVGHDADVVDNLRGATMRADVVLALINYLRSAGFPGYESADNGAEAVAARMEEVYGRRYGNGPFVPQAVREATQAARRERLQGASLIEDKVGGASGKRDGHRCNVCGNEAADVRG